MMEISRGPAKAEKFEIARRIMSISVHGAISSKLRASVKYGVVWAGRKNKIRNMTQVQLRSHEGSNSKSRYATMNECLRLAKFCFYAEMYEGYTAYSGN